MNWLVLINKRARKSVKKFPKGDQERIRLAMREMVTNPFIGDIEKTEGEQNIWRRRIGSYRIKFELNNSERIVYVFKFERRTSTTY